MPMVLTTICTEKPSETLPRYRRKAVVDAAIREERRGRCGFSRALRAA
jgi:hypothetical protein